MTEYLFSGLAGIIHTVAAVLALILGTAVLLMAKGTAIHKKIGYGYVMSMLVVIATAFMIYELFGGFGLFHVFALLSLVALVGGLYPAVFRKRIKHWYVQHVEVMSWSVVGLYAAFVAEISVRFFPPQYFFFIVGIGGGIITTMGAIHIKKEKRKIMNEIEPNMNSLPNSRK